MKYTKPKQKENKKPQTSSVLHNEDFQYVTLLFHTNIYGTLPTGEQRRNTVIVIPLKEFSF